VIQIDGEQFSYFAKSSALSPTPANTLYNVQCAQNGTTRAAHSIGATVVPLNNFEPSYPWPVTPTLNSGDTTPSGNAGYFPGMECGQRGLCFPACDRHRGQWHRVVERRTPGLKTSFYLALAERDQRRELELGQPHGHALRWCQPVV
jgi:hypothetical protein